MVASSLNTTSSMAARRVGGGGGGVTPYRGQNGEAPSEWGAFFRLQAYERVGISRVEQDERVGKYVITACERT